ncbi:unnamed protein product [Phytomonas sp. EM1]|nr:unnamed protein product [Phytomonas sp. EM1]|eukprot:CCW64059.1 unnamed protein product [Phytomonas sp. isolate EM1]
MSEQAESSPGQWWTETHELRAQKASNFTLIINKPSYPQLYTTFPYLDHHMRPHSGLVRVTSSRERLMESTLEGQKSSHPRQRCERKEESLQDQWSFQKPSRRPGTAPTLVAPARSRCAIRHQWRFCSVGNPLLVGSSHPRVSGYTRTVDATQKLSLMSRVAAASMPAHSNDGAAASVAETPSGCRSYDAGGAISSERRTLPPCHGPIRLTELALHMPCESSGEAPRPPSGKGPAGAPHPVRHRATPRLNNGLSPDQSAEVVYQHIKSLCSGRERLRDAMVFLEATLACAAAAHGVNLDR